MLMLGLAMMTGGVLAATPTTAQRLHIWKLLDAANKESFRAADLVYPVNCTPVHQSGGLTGVTLKNAEMTRRLQEKADLTIRKKYGLTQHQLDMLILEGINSHWPQTQYEPPDC